VAGVGEKRDACRVLVGKTEGEGWRGRRRRRRENSTEMDINPLKTKLICFI
jgi:hypothetical protein